MALGGSENAPPASLAQEEGQKAVGAWTTCEGTRMENFDPCWEKVGGMGGGRESDTWECRVSRGEPLQPSQGPPP